MNLEMLRKSDRIIFECIAGSHLYNLHTIKSDVDTRGIYKNPPTEYLGLSEPANQIGDERHDTTYYSLKRFFELAMTANPNILELAFVPEDCIKICKESMKKVIENRDLFISKKCFHTFSGYAYSQIGKASGQNKMINHPELFEKPKKEDFCWIIESDFLQGYRNEVFPCRPKILKDCHSHIHPDLPLNLSEYHVSALEHVSNTYRLYYYGVDAKGVFRGDDMLACESIPITDETDKFAGLLIYNQNEYEKALQQHRKYCEWIENRNDARWVDQENKKVLYDAKNMMHTFRLLMSGENILTKGFPLVRFEGEQRDYLMKIRAGEFKYEELMVEVEKRMARLEELYKTSTIPHSVDTKKIEALYRELSA
jgi:uncharacterized protein